MLQLKIEGERWQAIIEIPQGTILKRTAKDLWYKATISEARKIISRFGCYSWCAENKIMYVGSVSNDYKNGRLPNIASRISRYMGTHKGNTNVHVHGLINKTLQHSSVSLAHFVFDTLTIDGKTMTFAEYSADRNLIRPVEEVLICTYRRHGQCVWNRT